MDVHGEANKRLRELFPGDYRRVLNEVRVERGLEPILTERDRAQSKIEELREKFPDLFGDDEPPEVKAEEPSERVAKLMAEGTTRDPYLPKVVGDAAEGFDSNDYAWGREAQKTKKT